MAVAFFPQNSFLRYFSTDSSSQENVLKLPLFFPNEINAVCFLAHLKLSKTVLATYLNCIICENNASP